METAIFSQADSIRSVQGIEEFEREVLQSLEEVQAGKVAFRGDLDELRQRYEGVEPKSR